MKRIRTTPRRLSEAPPALRDTTTAEQTLYVSAGLNDTESLKSTRGALEERSCARVLPAWASRCCDLEQRRVKRPRPSTTRRLGSALLRQRLRLRSRASADVAGMRNGYQFPVSDCQCAVATATRSTGPSACPVATPTPSRTHARSPSIARTSGTTPSMRAPPLSRLARLLQAWLAAAHGETLAAHNDRSDSLHAFDTPLSYSRPSRQAPKARTSSSTRHISPAGADTHSPASPARLPSTSSREPSAILIPPSLQPRPCCASIWRLHSSPTVNTKLPRGASEQADQLAGDIGSVRQQRRLTFDELTEKEWLGPVTRCRDRPHRDATPLHGGSCPRRS